MAAENQPRDDEENNGAGTPDEAMPSASDDRVLDETARLVREGRRELEADPKETKPASQ